LLTFQFSLVAVATFLNLFRVRALNPTEDQNTERQGAILIASLVGPLLFALLFWFGFVFLMDRSRIPANEIFTEYRALHLTSGVSPLVPVFALCVGLYVWFWNSLHGLALFGSDRNRLPCEKDLKLEFSGVSVEVLRMFSAQTAKQTEDESKPLRTRQLLFAVAVFFVLLLVAFALNDGRWPLKSLGPSYSSKFFLCWLLLCASLMLTDAYQLVRVWARLRELLVFLDRLALRRTLCALRGFSWGSVWAMSGNVLDVRYKLLSRQLECLGHLLATLCASVNPVSLAKARSCAAVPRCIEALEELSGKGPQEEQLNRCIELLSKIQTSVAITAQKRLLAVQSSKLASPTRRRRLTQAVARRCIVYLKGYYQTNLESLSPAIKRIFFLEGVQEDGFEFATWYTKAFDKPDAVGLEPLKKFQKSVAEASGKLLTELLIPAWMKEKGSSILDQNAKQDQDEGKEPCAELSKDACIQNAEEFVCLPYLGFVQNILGRIRTIIMGMLSLFVATAVALSSYPFDPRQGLSAAMIVLFAVLAAAVLYVYAQMHRDTTLSHVTNTKPGELGLDFWLKTASIGIAPVLGLLATVFPQVSDFIFSWLEPGIQSMK
jgi:hypothetical protein